MEKIVLESPFDAHMHWREGTMMRHVAPYSIKQFSGGLLMPNTNPKILSWKEMEDYRKEVLLSIIAEEDDFFPLMTYFLSPDLTEEDLLVAQRESLLKTNTGFGGVKYYPKGGTTNSDKGMDGFNEVAHVLGRMEKLNIPLLIHGEVALDNVGVMIDDFDREKVFYESEMELLRKKFPELRLVMEHITTKEAVDFVLRHENVRATITPQHMLFDRKALFNGTTIANDSFIYDPNKNGMNPSVMCRPILKAEEHVRAIRKALKEQHEQGFKKFGLGTDTAPHVKEKKYCECGACGVFSAPIALELYAMAFKEIGILDHLNVFAGEIMPSFYGITDKVPKKTIVLEEGETQVLEKYNDIVPPFSNQTLPWKTSILN